MNPSDVREKIEHLISRGDASAASSLLGELWRSEPTASAASFVVQRFEKIRSHLNLVSYRLAILRSFTVEPVIPFLRAAGFLAGIDLQVQLSDFNAYVQEMVDPASRLYAFSPDAVILAVQTRDLDPALWCGSLPAEAEPAVVDRFIAPLRQWMQAVRRNTPAHLIVHNFEPPPFPGAGLLDAQTGAGQRAAILQINRELQALCLEQPNVYVLDYEALVSRHGYRSWHDERKWLTVRLPIAAPHLNDLAKEWLRFLHPLTGKVAKLLVVDLDNTLWKGIIGEDGLHGIRLGVEYPGAAFQELQRVLLDLHARGILLAICSKNNFDDAMEAIEKHPGMLLRAHHFAAMRINWRDKSQNLREIATELNLGTDAVAFLDDNPTERQQMRAELPEVMVLDLPNDPMEFARTLREYPAFERLSLSREDQERGTMYQAQRVRQALQNGTTSREEFFRSLEQEAEIAALSGATLPRIAQLINKTNQFNLTTRRYSEQQLLEMSRAPGWNCFSIAVRDRFGDNGLVGAAIAHFQQADHPICEIDTFLLSCRVIGRTVETAFLWFLADHARSRGARRLQGWFLPTKKNAPARDFYSSHGMTKASENGGASLWTLDLSASNLSCPDWIRLRVVPGDNL